ncbi:GNAT family N-acetyltransferase [Streptomyces sp. DSM 40750]|uniref:GNAT family N-acetyltransferase n=1 Tax=Streptomyces sp. DSM 40750 TaxID=2801030 RepID=UPI00214C6B3D|nr:GNAT family N-acetyltransferase [Streptomyces sp. DSM 40750]UUU21090.1 GNAT family N-acetyltransferase [Streptomyces sp. DSM 40750]
MIKDRVNRVTGARVIRTALPAEAPGITALHARARATYYPDGLPDDGTDWLASWRWAIERPDGHVLCAVEQGRITAIASFRTADGAPPDTVYLAQFHVDPEQWRRGTGRALHAACVEEWRADGKRTAGLSVHMDNHRARAFYEGLGWTPDPQHPPAPGDHHRLLTYTVTGE